MLLGAAVVFVAVALVLRSDVGAPPIVRGAPAPGFELPRLEAVDVSEPAEMALESLSGRVVLVNFWATWCEPCERELPAMERLYKALEGDDFELVAVAIDDNEDDVRKYQERYGLTFPILLDLSQSVYAMYQTMGVPESLLIDREGRIVERYVGPRDWDSPAYLDRIRALTAGESDVPAPGPG
jgi:thiol-disulfide isomerase/thioredoxin